MRFELITEWTLDHPHERVWSLLRDVEGWPGWWPSVRAVKQVARGDGTGVGAIHHFEWQTALPYRLSFEMEILSVELHRRLEARAVGDLDGRGVWTLREEAGRTRVRYQWSVETKKPWMRLLAPFLGPVFAWNHGRVMERGRQGLERALASGSRRQQ